ncbi:AAA domain-containing protein [Bacillus spongiae]|uniref:AAA domain-containing protein n=1 Tax=Bacillus spongiae TaxID=2683610 RepID=A0ABU8HFH4_9BACI
MKEIVTWVKEWQKALAIEIQHLKKYGSTKYRIQNGRMVSNEGRYAYYFDTSFELFIPIGSLVRMEWGSMTASGTVLSSEGKGLILSFEVSLGDLISEAWVLHDPWELLDQLSERLAELKKSKQKLTRIHRLLHPTMEDRHPREKVKSPVHELILRSKYNPVTFVWGPPGTGKTYTLARVAANKYFKGQKVLILSHSNQAVDVMMKETATFIEHKEKWKEGDVIRYGSQVSSIISDHPSLSTDKLIQIQFPTLFENKQSLVLKRKALKKDLSSSFSTRDSEDLLKIEGKYANVLDKLRQREAKLVKDANVIGVTLAKAAMDPNIYEKQYDLVIVDEASMAYVPQAAFAASLGRRTIVCGDFKQLPPIAVSRHELVAHWLKEDVFHRSGVADSVENGNLHPHLFLLKEQRRMHPEISAFTNRVIYHSLVGDHKDVRESREPITELSPFSNRASVLVDTSHAGNYCMKEKNSHSRINIWSAFLSIQLIQEAFRGGASSIGYVTPYRAQAQLVTLLLQDLLEKELTEADIIAATVHKFQGSERDVMVFDSVDSYPESRPGMLLVGKNSERLINVAITRTKGKFIHVADVAFIQQQVYSRSVFKQLYTHQRKTNQLVTTNEIGTWIKHQQSKLQWMHAKKISGLAKDLLHAKQSILLSLPEDVTLSEKWIELIQEKSTSMDVTIVSRTERKWSSAIRWMCEEMPFPFIVIDESVLWTGAFFEGMPNVRPPFIAVRLQSETFIHHLYSAVLSSNQNEA